MSDADAVTVGGEFWIPEQPDRRVRGEFTSEAGQKPEVSLVDRLVDDAGEKLTSGRVVTVTHTAADRVKAFLPITLQGQLDTGESVTLLHAQNHGGRGLFDTPRYVAYNAVVGDAHVSGEDQLYAAVRFRLDHPYWLGHLEVGQPSVVDDDGSELSVEISDDVGKWLVYSSSSPATLRQLDIRVLSGCLVLAQLAIGLEQELVIRQTEVRINDSGTWLAVQGPGLSAPIGGLEPETLLPREVLTVERFAKWIALNDKLDGLAQVVANPKTGTLQERVLVATPLVEGLHRRLPYQHLKFPSASKNALDRIEQVARRAAREKAETEQNLDPEEVREAVMNAVSHFEDVDYLQRAADVVTEVCGVVPEIAESVADLPRRLTEARNELAHHLVPDEEKDPLAMRVLRWIVISNVTPWLLRCLLLLRAGIEPQVLRQRLLMYQRFWFFRANTAQHVKELGWELPSPDSAGRTSSLGPGD
jgi:ApeA N-terminal domain 1/Apea-like HEPN